MTEREMLRKQVVEALDELEDWQLDLVARAARPLSATTGFGIASYLLGLRSVRPEGDKVVGEIDVSTLHLNPHGVAHGVAPGRIRVEARLVHAGGRIAVTEGRLFDDQGRLCTLATGTYYRMSGERTEKRRGSRTT